MRFLLFAVAMIIVAGCKKYDEGPTLSLRSVDRRLFQQWRVDGTTASDSVKNYYSAFGLSVGTVWTISENEISSAGYGFNHADLILSTDKKTLSITNTYHTADYEILRLTNKELKLQCNEPVPYTILFSAR